MIKGETDIGHQILLVFTLVSINVQILFIVHRIKGTDVSCVTESLKLFVVLIDIISFDIGFIWHDMTSLQLI